MTLPALTPSDFEMRWDADHTFPFTENEDATIMAHGHHDPAEFVKQIKVYDTLVNGPEPYDDVMDEGEVKHYWAVRTNVNFEDVDDGEDIDGWWIKWGGITQDTPNAFPVTVVTR